MGNLIQQIFDAAIPDTSLVTLIEAPYLLRRTTGARLPASDYMRRLPCAVERKGNLIP